MTMQIQYDVDDDAYTFSTLPGTSYSRAGPGTALTASGSVTSFLTGVPRITDRGLLIEGAATNFVRQSQTLTAAEWSGVGMTRTAGHAIAPDGTMTADRIEFAAGTSYVSSSTSGGCPTNTTVTMSFWAKAVSAGHIIASRSGASGLFALHTLTTSWQRFTWTFLSHSTTEVAQLANGGLVSGASATSDFHVWGIQLEVGSNATSYIATTTAAVTRPVDTMTSTISIPNNVDFVVYTEVSLSGASATQQRFVELDAGSNANRIVVYRANDGTVVTSVTVASSSVVLASTVKAGARTLKVAVRRVGSSYQMFVDGVALAASTVAALPTLTTLFDGHGRSNATPINDYVRRRAVFFGPYSDAACIALTT